MKYKIERKIIFPDKEENQCFIVDISVPGDARIAEKENRKRLKITKISDKREITRLVKIVEHQGLCLW